MSSQGFSFPPPPPPPPTASAYIQAGPPQWNAERGRGRARDERGRGRGRGDRPPRGGFEQYRGGGYNASRGNRGNDFRGRGSANYNQDGRGQKRRHDQAFNHRNVPSVPPPVPSFGFQMPLAVPSPVPAKSAANPGKAAKANLFGLTPSFDEKDGQGDEDEEAKYAAQTANETGVEFTYRGQTASLKSAAEIAAWIAERRKRFATKAKAEAAALKAKAESEDWERRKAEFAEERRQRMEAGKGRGRGRGRGRGDGPGRGRGRTDKGNTETDKLQEELLQARKRIAELEKKAKKRSSDPRSAAKEDSGAENEDLLASSSDIDSAGRALDDSEDGTSSSGDSSSAAEDDADSDDEAPAEESSKRQGPEKVIIPPREKPKQPCHEFLRTGRCSKGQRCHFQHDPAQAAKKGKQTTSRPGAVNGKTLYQRLTEQEREISDELVLQHILYLGDKGFLAETNPAEAEAA